MYRLTPGLELILASASPRRRELLGRIGLEFAVAPAHVDEAPAPDETAQQAAQRLAQAKALATPAGPGQVVLAADTLVTIDGVILGKPADQAQAVAMLERLNGREHQVVTGFHLRWPGGQRGGLGLSNVRFRRLAPAEIAAYVRSGEPMGKAGAYAVQGLGAALVEAVSGSYTNVVGLPLAAVVKLLLELGLIAPNAEERP